MVILYNKAIDSWYRFESNLIGFEPMWVHVTLRDEWSGDVGWTNWSGDLLPETKNLTCENSRLVNSAARRKTTCMYSLFQPDDLWTFPQANGILVVVQQHSVCVKWNLELLDEPFRSRTSLSVGLYERNARILAGWGQQIVCQNGTARWKRHWLEVTPSRCTRLLAQKLVDLCSNRSMADYQRRTHESEHR